jgi:hypothetical protein
LILVKTDLELTNYIKKNTIYVSFGNKKEFFDKTNYVSLLSDTGDYLTWEWKVFKEIK